MKKFISILLALMLVMSLGTAAFAASEPTNVNFTKDFVAADGGSTLEETFAFEQLTKEVVSSEGTAGDITIGNVTLVAGESGSFDIGLPAYDRVGTFKYTFKETAPANETAGVDYSEDVITMYVYVTNGANVNDPFEVQVRFENANGQKLSGNSAKITNTYNSGSLKVTKNVEGNLADHTKEFEITVTFSGSNVNSNISYLVGTETKTITPEMWENGTVSATVALKADATVTFTNIPAGVTYVVSEKDYTADGYELKGITYSDVENKAIAGGDEDSVTVLNSKNGTIETGISLDSLPYILMLVVVGAAIVVVSTRKKGEQF